MLLLDRVGRCPGIRTSARRLPCSGSRLRSPVASLPGSVPARSMIGSHSMMPRCRSEPPRLRSQIFRPLGPLRPIQPIPLRPPARPRKALPLLPRTPGRLPKLFHKITIRAGRILPSLQISQFLPLPSFRMAAIPWIRRQKIFRPMIPPLAGRVLCFPWIQHR